MPNARDIRLDKYNITSKKYRELKYFCLQYPEWKHELNTLMTSVKSPVITGMPGGNNNSDQTGDLATRRAELSKKCNLIEETAKEANEGISSMILKNVTEGITYEKMFVPSGRRMFYEGRRRFFYLLSQKR